jgi:hypothetical protein
VSFESFVGIAPRLYLSLFDASKIDRKEENGAVVKCQIADSLPRLSEDPKSYVTRESFLHNTMNDFFESKERKTEGGKSSHEKTRSGTARVQEGSSGSKKSPSLDARTRTTNKARKRKTNKRNSKKGK